jgi:hypothetical protein
MPLSVSGREVGDGVRDYSGLDGRLLSGIPLPGSE